MICRACYRGEHWNCSQPKCDCGCDPDEAIYDLVDEELLEDPPETSAAAAEDVEF